MTKADRNRIKALLTEAITVLCKNGLTYKDEFAIEGLLGITLDSSEVFLVSINETIKNELAEARENLRRQQEEAAERLSSRSSPGHRHSASPAKQVPHSVPVSRHVSHSPGSHHKNIPQPISVYKNSKSGQYQQIHPSATRKRSADDSSQDLDDDLELHVQAVEQGEDEELDDLNETFQTEQSESVISRLSDSASGEPPSKRAARDESYRTDSRSPAESGDSENESKYKPEEPDIIFVKQEVTDDTDENSSASQSRTRIPHPGEDPQPGCSNWDASNNQLNINSPTSFLPTPDQQQGSSQGQRSPEGHSSYQASGPLCWQISKYQHGSSPKAVLFRVTEDAAHTSMTTDPTSTPTTVSRLNCTMCEKTFTSEQGVRLHMDSAHYHIRYSCTLCSATFAQAATLKRHVRSVHENQTFTCPVCSKAIRRKDHFHIHLKLHQT